MSDLYSQSQFNLLTKRRFFPLFLAQLLGAFNDNLVRNGMLVLLTFQVASRHVGVLGNVMGICFIAPFFLFSAYAGLLADRFDKAVVARWVKFSEVLVCCLAALSLWVGSYYLFLTVLFLLGAQSAFFGPVKYAVLPQYLSATELVAGNALVESSTFIAILLGTLAGGLMVTQEYGLVMMSVALVLLSASGWIASLFMPPGPSYIKQAPQKRNALRLTLFIIEQTYRQRAIFLAILGLSWFWLVGVVFMTQIPSFVKMYLGGAVHIVTYFMTLFSLGVGVGSLLCHGLLRGKVSTKYVPLALLFMSFFVYDVFAATHHMSKPQAAQTWLHFMSQPIGWRLSLDLFLAACFGGIYTVPLYAFMQHKSADQFRSRTIACNNIINSIFMVLGLALTGGALWLGVPLTIIFLWLSIASFVVSIIIFGLIPEAFVKVMFKWVLKKLFRVTVHGMEHYERVQGKAIVVANHTSYLDAALLAAFLPDRVFFAVNTLMASKWWMRIIMKLSDTFTVDPTKPMSMKTIINQVNRNRKCVIFPEGRITVTGSLMKVYEGPGVIADKTGAPLIPIRIDGAQYSYLSRLRKKSKLRLFPKVTITILPPKQLFAEEKSSRVKRKKMGQQLHQLMTDMMMDSVNLEQNILQRLMDMISVKGLSKIVMEDINRIPVSYRTLLVKSFALSALFKRSFRAHDRVGLLMPTLCSTVVAFLGMHLRRAVPAMLNFSAGTDAVLAACETADVKIIISSREFVEKAHLTELVSVLEQAGISFLWLEDQAKRVNIMIKVRAWCSAHAAVWFGTKHARAIAADDPAVVLFSSGSEGKPKAVLLSHKNIVSNVNQVLAVSDFYPSDIIFNFMPLFHSFGLTAGTILPLLTGVRTFLYPNPLHFRVIPELVYDTNATILFATNTFLLALAKNAHPYDFYSVRSIYAGAEKLKQATAKLWLEEYGVRIFEGYGVTETSPVLAVNTALAHRQGSVGKALPGVQCRLDTVPGLETGKKLLVKGPNVMLGYISPEHSSQIIAPPGGWHDTGDVVRIDDDGYIFIVGRAKRFAKISGEMVSLAMVEEYVALLWSDAQSAVISVPHEAKGEQIILLTTQDGPDLMQLARFAKQHGKPEIAIPKKAFTIAEMPLLPTGKVDYQKLSQVAADLMQASAKHDGAES